MAPFYYLHFILLYLVFGLTFSHDFKNFLGQRGNFSIVGGLISRPFQKYSKMLFLRPFSTLSNKIWTSILKNFPFIPEKHAFNAFLNPARHICLQYLVFFSMFPPLLEMAHPRKTVCNPKFKPLPTSLNNNSGL